MADLGPRTSGEKLTAGKLKDFLVKRKSQTVIDANDNINEKDGKVTTEAKLVPQVPPVSFVQLFRSATFLLQYGFNLTLLLGTPHHSNSV